MATGNGGQVVRLPALVTLERDDLGEVYVARCLAVEVTSHGDTHEQALANLREALELYFEDSPSPRSTPTRSLRRWTSASPRDQAPGRPGLEVVRALERAGFVQISVKAATASSGSLTGS